VPRRFRRWTEIIRVVGRTPELRDAFYLRAFWAKQHAWLLLGIAGAGLALGLLAAGTPWWWAALPACLPYLWFLLRASRETMSLPERIAFAPVRLAADAIEVGMLAVGSARHRTLLL
jgi:hypothetical protein